MLISISTFIFFFFLTQSKTIDDIPVINLDEGNKRERSSNKSKDKRDKVSYGDIEVRSKEKRVSRKRNL